MISYGLEGVDFIVANTDAQSLNLSQCSKKIQLGKDLTAGLGAGAVPDVGKEAAMESAKELKAYIEGSHIIFIKDQKNIAKNQKILELQAVNISYIACYNRSARMDNDAHYPSRTITKQQKAFER